MLSTTQDVDTIFEVRVIREHLPGTSKYVIATVIFGLGWSIVFFLLGEPAAFFPFVG